MILDVFSENTPFLHKLKKLILKYVNIISLSVQNVGMTIEKKERLAYSL